MDKNTYEMAARDLERLGCKRPTRCRVSVENAKLALVQLRLVVVARCEQTKSTTLDVGRRWLTAWDAIATKAAFEELLTHVRPPSNFMDLETLQEEYNKVGALLGTEKYKHWPYYSHLERMRTKYTRLIVQLEAALAASLDGRGRTTGRSPKKMKKSEESRVIREQMKGRKVSEDKGRRR